MKPAPDPATADAGATPRLHHGFVQEGQFFAFELGVPEEASPIPAEASFITCLAASPCGRWVTGVSGGAGRYLFCALFKGAAGGVVPLGTLPREVVAMRHTRLPSRKQPGALIPGVVLGTQAGCHFELWRARLPLATDVLQEPNLASSGPKVWAQVDGARGRDVLEVPGEQTTWLVLSEDSVIHLARDGKRRLGCWAAPPGAVPPAGARLHASGAGVFWLAGPGWLGQWTRDSGAAWRRLDGPVGEGPVAGEGVIAPGVLGVVSAGGGLWRIDLARGRAERSVEAPLSPVQIACVLPGGRVYGMAGAEVAHFFRAETATGASEPLGAVATALGRRRYGFEFAASAASREGVLFFGEHDRGGHLWAYYPPALPGFSIARGAATR